MAQQQHRSRCGSKYHPCYALHPWSEATGQIQGDASRESKRCLRVSPPAPQPKLWVPSIFPSVFICLCVWVCNCSLAMLERSRGQIHRMVLNWAHNWFKLLLFQWFTDSTQTLHTVWALEILKSNRWGLWVISFYHCLFTPFIALLHYFLNPIK